MRVLRLSLPLVAVLFLSSVCGLHRHPTGWYRGDEVVNGNDLVASYTAEAGVEVAVWNCGPSAVTVQIELDGAAAFGVELADGQGWSRSCDARRVRLEVASQGRSLVGHFLLSRRALLRDPHGALHPHHRAGVDGVTGTAGRKRADVR